MDDEYVVKIFENIQRMLFARGLSSEDVFEKMKQMYNELEIPVRIEQIHIKKLNDSIKAVIERIFDTRKKSTLISRNDSYLWIRYAAEKYEILTEFLLKLYDDITEERSMDINELAEKEYRRLEECPEYFQKQMHQEEMQEDYYNTLKKWIMYLNC